MSATAAAADPGSATTERSPDSLLASILIAATGLFFALLAAIGPFLADDVAVTIRLPPEPGSRVIGYRVTVAISEPPRQPFIPRPVERAAPIVATAPIRDERDLPQSSNRGAALAEAGGDNVRIFADRLLGSTPQQRWDLARWDLPPRPRGGGVDRAEISPRGALAEAATVPSVADAIVATQANLAAPDDVKTGYAADRLLPSDLDLWAVAAPLEDNKAVPPGWIASDRAVAEAAVADEPSAVVLASADAITPFLDAAPAREPMTAEMSPPAAADQILQDRPGLALGERLDRSVATDRLETASARAALAEANVPVAGGGDRWTIARSDFAATDAGIARFRSADGDHDQSRRPGLSEVAPTVDTPTDGLAGVAPLSFDPEDAVFVTAILPDWSEWDDAIRRSALEERALLRNAAWSPGADQPEKLAASPASSRGLIDLFDRHNFRLGGATVVPALFIQRLPSDISSMPQAADRKALFLRALLPFVVASNERITRQRERLIDLLPLIEQGLPLGSDDRRFLERIQADFRVSRLDPEELLRRIDIVPASLALAQAAEESGWGTSRPAREDNSLFGQMVFHEGGMRLREFDNLRETVEAYIRNLNTHRAYADFRQKRAQLRRASRPLDSHVLVGHIERYSERGIDYIAAIRGLMTANGLRNFDDAKLSDIEFLVQATAR